jgi:hypothetical protein
MDFLMEFLLIRDHFTIVIWQKSIVKWSQKMIFVDGSAIFGTPKYFENCRFQCNFKIWGLAKKGVSFHKNHVLRPLYNRLLPYYYCKVVSD